LPKLYLKYLEELVEGHEPAILTDLLQRTPPGVVDLLGVRGLGPKRVRTLWQELGITSPGELQYACLENRLVKLPGFGPATQTRLLEAVGDIDEQTDGVLFHSENFQALSSELTRLTSQVAQVERQSSGLCRGRGLPGWRGIQ